MAKLILFLLIAILVSFLCSILEAVLLSTTLPYIKSIQGKGSRLLKKLKEEINRPIAAILTVNTIAHTVGAAGVGAESAKVFGEQYMIVVSGVLTLAILYFSEIIPKTIGAIYWKQLAIPSAYIIKWLIWITLPLIWIADFTTRIFAGKKQETITREELLANALLSEDAGVIDETESDIIENTLSMPENTVENILTPRSVVFALEKNTSIANAIEFRDSLRTFSRIPVFEESIDRIVGMALSKEILLAGLGAIETTLEELIKPVYEIPEEMSVSGALSSMMSRNEQLFVVKDNFGQTAGVVTMEDCLETLLGAEIVDELDQVEDLQILAKRLLKNK